jgi:hypothetical protein
MPSFIQIHRVFLDSRLWEAVTARCDPGPEWGCQHPQRGWGACRMVIEVAAAEPVLGTAPPCSRNLGEATDMNRVSPQRSIPG